MRILNCLIKTDAEECTSMGFDTDTTSFLMLLRALSMKKVFGLNAEKMIEYSNVSIHEIH